MQINARQYDRNTIMIHDTKETIANIIQNELNEKLPQWEQEIRTIDNYRLYILSRPSTTPALYRYNHGKPYGYGSFIVCIKGSDLWVPRHTYGHIKIIDEYKIDLSNPQTNIDKAIQNIIKLYWEYDSKHQQAKNDFYTHKYGELTKQ